MFGAMISPNESPACLQSGPMRPHHSLTREQIFVNHTRLHHLHNTVRAHPFRRSRTRASPPLSDLGRHLSKTWWRSLIRAARHNRYMLGVGMTAVQGMQVLRQASALQMGHPIPSPRRGPEGHKRSQRHANPLKSQPIPAEVSRVKQHISGQQTAGLRLPCPRTEQLLSR